MQYWVEMFERRKAVLDDELTVLILFVFHNSKVKLLKNGGSLESLNDSAALIDLTEDSSKQEESDELVNLRQKVCDKASPRHLNLQQYSSNNHNLIPIINSKVKRLETLLAKCKETIKGHKERSQTLTKEKDQLTQELEEKIAELKSLQVHYFQQIIRYSLDFSKLMRINPIFRILPRQICRNFDLNSTLSKKG